MKINEAFAIAILERMQNPEPYEPQITEEAYEALAMAIRALRWIPVSERLPKEDGTYTVSGVGNNGKKTGRRMQVLCTRRVF